MMNLKLVILTAACTLAATQAQADELQNRVLASIRASRADAFTFQRAMVFDSSGSPRKTIVERYDPRRPAADRWTLVSVDARAPTPKDIERSRKTRRSDAPSYSQLAEFFGAPARRSDGPAGYVTYHFDRLPAGALKIGSHDASADTQADAFVNVKGNIPFLERVRFTSTKGFRMMLIASVQSMDLSRRYTQLSSGAVVPESSASSLKGSYLGKVGHMETATSFSGFQAVK